MICVEQQQGWLIRGNICFFFTRVHRSMSHNQLKRMSTAINQYFVHMNPYFDWVMIHPDCNLIFFTVGEGVPFVCYNMDTQEVEMVPDSINCLPPYFFYVPLYSELPSLHMWNQDEIAGVVPLQELDRSIVCAKEQYACYACLNMVLLFANWSALMSAWL